MVTRFVLCKKLTGPCTGSSTEKFSVASLAISADGAPDKRKSDGQRVGDGNVVCGDVARVFEDKSIFRLPADGHKRCGGGLGDGDVCALAVDLKSKRVGDVQVPRSRQPDERGILRGFEISRNVRGGYVPSLAASRGVLSRRSGSVPRAESSACVRLSVGIVDLRAEEVGDGIVGRGEFVQRRGVFAEEHFVSAYDGVALLRGYEQFSAHWGGFGCDEAGYGKI